MRDMQKGPNLFDDLNKIVALERKLNDAKAERESLLGLPGTEDDVAYLDVTIRRIPLAINHIEQRVRASLVGKVKYFSDFSPKRKQSYRSRSL
jgi:hypothetical protein